MFLLPSSVQSHSSRVRRPVLHVHHTGLLYVLDGLWHLLLLLLHHKHNSVSDTISSWEFRNNIFFIFITKTDICDFNYLNFLFIF